MQDSGNSANFVNLKIGAGLASGNHGWCKTMPAIREAGSVTEGGNLMTQPMDVEFELMKIHPLECGYGLGYTYYYLRDLDENWATSPKRRDYVDLSLATTIAYGHMGRLVEEAERAIPTGGTYTIDNVANTGWGLDVLTQSYYMMQQLQQRYAFVRPKLIEYADARPEVRAVYDDIKKTRNVPDVNNFWKAVANDPATLKRTWESLKDVMAPGALDPLTKEMLYLAVSVAHNCEYCIASHAAAARKKGMTDQMFAELMAVVGMASETNRLVTGWRVPLDEAFQ
jgi:AhpD family alkylhydroperoxidase